MLIPSFAISLSAIKQRPPLGPKARRAGWIGCTIHLEGIPQTAKIALVSDGIVSDPKSVREAFMRLRPLGKLELTLRGWTLDVFTQLQKLSGRNFALQEVYSFESELSEKHPGNYNVRAKIRQQLQMLRDLGLLEFLGKGTYRVVERSGEPTP